MKIFISHTANDLPFVHNLTQFLIKQNHHVEKRISGPLSKGSSVLGFVDEQMRAAEVLIIIWGKQAINSQYAQNELFAAKMLADTDKSKYIIPIVLDGAKVSFDLARFLCIRMNSSRPDFTQLDVSLQQLGAPKKQKETHGRDLETLQKAHREGNLTLVCGAGVSIGANIPAWNTLLDRLLDAMLERLLDEKSDIEAARSDLTDIRENSSLIAGRYLKNVLKDDFQEEVRNALYKDNNATCETIDAIVELARPKRGQAHLDSIISFNFDDLLEQKFKSASIEHKPIFSEGSRSSSTELPIFHVHGFLPATGKIKKENKIVFSEDSYHDQFVDPFSWSNLTQLNKFTQNTCLFVGLSMTDPNLRRLLDVAIRRDGDGGKRHFAILKRNLSSSKDRMMESLREQDAASLGITILWVNEFEDIPVLIRDLA